MERKRRVRAIWGLAGALLAVAAIVVPLLVLAGSGQATLTAETYADVIRFGVQGAGTLQIQIYDLSEKVLWDSGAISSDFIDWDRTDTWGERLANGYYMYLAQAWDMSGSLILSKTGKVALLPGDQVQLQQAPSSEPQGAADPGDVPASFRPKATGFTGSLILNNGSVYYQKDTVDQYVQGMSGVGGYQFMTLQPGRYFYFVSPSGSARAAMSFDTGSLGLGRANATAQLDIKNTASQPALRIESSAGTNLIEAYNATGLVFRVERATGNVGIGSTSPVKKLDVVGDAAVSGTLGIGTTNATARLTVQGTSGDLIAAYNSSNRVFAVSSTGEVRADGAVYAASFNTGSADVAERINTSEWVEAGDVVEIDPDHTGFFRKSADPYSRRVAGIISTSPGVILGNSTDSETDDWDDSRPVLAIAGRVPTSVSAENGPIAVGDLLVSSSTPGVAMRGDPSISIGAVVGKAMEPFDEGEGTIMAQVTLR